jgi:hypothetical protein
MTKLAGDPSKGLAPTPRPRTPALIRSGAATALAIGLVGCGAGDAIPPQAPPPPDVVSVPPQAPPPQVVPPQAPPPPQVAPPPPNQPSSKTPQSAAPNQR